MAMVSRLVVSIRLISRLLLVLAVMGLVLAPATGPVAASTKAGGASPIALSDDMPCCQPDQPMPPIAAVACLPICAFEDASDLGNVVFLYRTPITTAKGMRPPGRASHRRDTSRATDAAAKILNRLRPSAGSAWHVSVRLCDGPRRAPRTHQHGIRHHHDKVLHGRCSGGAMGRAPRGDCVGGIDDYRFELVTPEAKSGVDSVIEFASLIPVPARQ